MCGVQQAAQKNQVPVKFELILAESVPGNGLVEATIEDESRQKIYLHKEAVITNKDIAEARVVRSQTGASYDIEIELTDEAAERFSKVTAENIGKSLAVILDGKVLSAPVIMSQISRNGVLTGNFTREEAERIAGGIKSK
jgi:preprotein translocase subunit SecD